MGTTKDVRDGVEAELEFDPLVDDAVLTTAANDALALNVTVPDGAEATARDGNLTLTGAVGYGPQRQAAELAVAGLVGVRNVKDDVVVSYDADPVDVTRFVRDALERHALIGDDSDVSVDTSGNTVTLRGHVTTWAEHDAVVGAAWMAGGVMQVRDDLEITS
jgi:osmotically-inducible protein OsmY